MSRPDGLNNADPVPPPEAREKLDEAARQSSELDSPQRTNDSTIDPEKPDDKILEGYHGG